MTVQSMTTRFGTCALRWILILSVVAFPSITAAAPATGPLRVLKSNPRYFTDGSGRAVYLAGTHIWHNFQDNGHRLPKTEDPPPVFDYDKYLNFLQAHNHNFFRLWRWEVPKWTDAQPRGVIKYCQPHPWMRTGPGMANDGKPKFDLTRFNQEYFDRMHARVQAAQDKGIYVSIMLFEGWAVQFLDAWNYHPYNKDNNVNSLNGDADGDGRGVEYYTLQSSETGKGVLAAQEAYLRKLIDSINDLDNVLYEVCNEAAAYSTDWQYHIINFVKQYESAKPKQHPVGMTFQYKGGTNAALYDSPADWISPNPGDTQESYRDNPSSAHADKVIVNDTDHLWGHTGGDSIWVWKSFTRGLNVLFMEELLPSPTWQDSARAAMGQTRTYSQKVNLAAMKPHNDWTETTYCLADPGKEYLVFQPGNKGEFSVNLTDAPGTYSVEWLNVNTGTIAAGKSISGGSARTFTTPFGGPAVLYLKVASRDQQ